MYEEQQLKAVFDTAVDGILSTSADGRVRLYNRASERIFGYPAKDVIGKDVSMLMPSAVGAAHGRYMTNYLNTGEAGIIGVGREVEGRRADGTIVPLHLSIGEFQDGDERHFVGIVRDLTKEVAARQRIQALAEQLDLIGRHSAVSEMGAALAHELNQPLTAIDLFLSAADMQLKTDPEKARETFQRVRAEASRAGSIVRRIREMVERADGDKSAFPLSEVVQSAVELCRFADRTGAAVSIERAPEVLVFAEPTQIRMILVNLVKNALDATAGQNGGEVMVRTATKGDRVEVTVLDNGPGVAEEMRDRLFEAFASSKAKGLGIGLSICSTLAEAHDGRLHYLPPEDQERSLGGAAFVLNLPLYKDDQQ